MKDANQSVAEFLLEVEAVCRRHGYVLSHDAGHGHFEVEELDEGLLAYLMQAKGTGVSSSADRSA